jgi:hypothetical protein
MMATRYGVLTGMKAGDVLKEAIAYFGPEGLGLQVTGRSLTSVRLEGSGGFVEVQVRVGDPTEVELLLHEWEWHAEPFADRIRKRRAGWLDWLRRA